MAYGDDPLQVERIAGAETSEVIGRRSPVLERAGPPRARLSDLSVTMFHVAMPSRVRASASAEGLRIERSP